MQMLISTTIAGTAVPQTATALPHEDVGPVPASNSDTADAELFKLHDDFCGAYAKMIKLGEQGGGGAGSLDSGTRKEKAINRKWERAAEVAFRKARCVIDAPAMTLEGMLMKFHVAGFLIDDTKRGTFSMPYHSSIREWEPGKFCEGDEVAALVSLRSDLQRFAGRMA
jgi:hypothetical protein